MLKILKITIQICTATFSEDFLKSYFQQGKWLPPLAYDQVFVLKNTGTEQCDV